MGVQAGDMTKGKGEGMFGKNSNGKAQQTKSRYAKDESVYSKTGVKANGGKEGSVSFSAKARSGNAGVVHSSAKTWGGKVK